MEAGGWRAGRCKLLSIVNVADSAVNPLNLFSLRTCRATSVGGARTCYKSAC